MVVEVVHFKDLVVLVVLVMVLIPLNNLKVSIKILEWMMMKLGFSLEEKVARKVVTILKEVHLVLVDLEVLEVLMMTS